MNETIKNTLKSLVAEIERLHKCEKEIDASQAFMPTYANVDRLSAITRLRNYYQNKINNLIKGL